MAPDGPSGPGAVITVTAVGTSPIARRNWAGSATGGTGTHKYDAAALRAPKALVISAAAAVGLLLSACGSEEISVPKSDPT